MTIDILCKVIDNFGDIGFVYRLFRSLIELDPYLTIRITVDDLLSFHSLCPSIDSEKKVQKLGSASVIKWDESSEEISSLYKENPLEIILECYSCGRPEQFDQYIKKSSITKKIKIMSIEYLSAEDWVLSFHKLSSLSPYSNVSKYFFMPGITAGTGGLLRNDYFEKLSSYSSDSRLKLRRYLSSNTFFSCSVNGRSFSSEDADVFENSFWSLFFTYEGNFAGAVQALAMLSGIENAAAVTAAGKSQQLFRDAWEKTGRRCTLIELPMLEQDLWDTCMAASDVLLIRGEESFSRAVLLSRPFLWHCYPYSGTQGEKNGQMDKVNAFLAEMKKYMSAADFALYEKLMTDINTNNKICAEDFNQLCQKAADKSSDFSRAFIELSNDVRKIGNLADNLLTFIRTLV